MFNILNIPTLADMVNVNHSSLYCLERKQHQINRLTGNQLLSFGIIANNLITPVNYPIMKGVGDASKGNGSSF